MDKNENGYPIIDGNGNNGIVGGVTDNGGCGGICGGGCGRTGGANGHNGDTNGGGCGRTGGTNGHNGDTNGRTCGGTNGHTCGGDGSCLDGMSLAYAYAPDQMFRLLYSAKDALKHGTLFEELYKPKEVYGRE